MASICQCTSIDAVYGFMEVYRGRGSSNVIAKKKEQWPDLVQGLNVVTEAHAVL